MEAEEQLELLKKVSSQLGEHFDSVQIFVTVYNGSDGVTRTLHHGTGNFSAIYGQVREWVVEQEGVMRNRSLTD